MERDEKFDQLVKLAARDTEKAAEIVARSFYKILRRNGFADDQIIGVANSILDCLILTLDGYKEKSEKKMKSRTEAEV